MAAAGNQGGPFFGFGHVAGNGDAQENCDVDALTAAKCPAGSAAALDTGRLCPYPWGMDVIPIKPERKAQLDDYAQRYGQSVAAAPGEGLAARLHMEATQLQQDRK